MILETEEQRQQYAAEQLTIERAETGERMPAAGPERWAAVQTWLLHHPEIVVGVEVDD